MCVLTKLKKKIKRDSKLYKLHEMVTLLKEKPGDNKVVCTQNSFAK